MAQAEVVIDENFCLSCGYCVEFCPKGCLVMSEDLFSSKGYRLPLFVNAEKCNACGICVWMCPSWAISVYRYSEAKTA